MTQLILASTKEIEFSKKFETQIKLNNALIISNFIIWLAAIFLLGSCGSPVYPTRRPTLDKGEVTALQCLKISKPKSSLSKRPFTSKQSTASARVYGRRHN